MAAGLLKRAFTLRLRDLIMHKGCTIWITGMSGAGKSTIARLLQERLRSLDHRVEVLDGDIVRTRLSKGLGFSKEDRDENIRRIGFVCELLSRNGVIAIAAAISPYRATRDEVRSRIRDFVEVYVECPIEVLAERDVKGLYKKALAGTIQQFTGISDPYEPPLAPEVIVNSSRETPTESLEKIWTALAARGLVLGVGDSETEKLTYDWYNVLPPRKKGQMAGD
jgi:adenylyl-sulfate kinase